MPKSFRDPTPFSPAHSPFSRQTLRMDDTSRRDRVGLGLIGLGPSWEQVYRDALVRLQNRLTIRVVYDPVEARARAVASDFNATVAGSLRQILQHRALQGVLMLDSGWHGPAALRLVACGRKPVFLGSPMMSKIYHWRMRSSPGSSAIEIPSPNELLMPEFRLRFTPASCRLRELIATRLGAAHRIEIEHSLSDDIESMAELVDWCASIFGQEPALPEAPIGNSPASSGFELKFPGSAWSRDAATPRPKSALLTQQSQRKMPLKIDVVCERGQATLFHRTKIHWSTGTESAQETLTEERTETEILIDQFCRRALGGLNPVGQFSELLKAIEVAKSIQRQCV